jgi:hypothetical protein
MKVPDLFFLNKDMSITYVVFSSIMKIAIVLGLAFIGAEVVRSITLILETIFGHPYTMQVIDGSGLFHHR